MTKPAELRDLAAADLQTRLREAKEEMFNLRFRAATRQLENSMRTAQVRKDVARIKTILRQRQLAGVE